MIVYIQQLQQKQFQYNYLLIYQQLQFMPYNDQLTLFQQLLMGTVVVITNLAALPSVIYLWKQEQFQFQSIIVLLSMSTSVMYHLCETVDKEIFLTEYDWHRLDNVFAIACSSIYALHLFGCSWARKIVYSTLMISILVQEKDPWSFEYTFGVIVGFGILAFALRLFNYKSIMIKYNWQKTITSIVLLGVGGLFFIWALDFRSDYLRLKHGFWHMFAFFSIYFGVSCLQKIQKQTSCSSNLKQKVDFDLQEKIPIKNQLPQ